MSEQVVRIDKELYRQAKIKAATEGKSLTQALNELLTQALQPTAKKEKKDK